MIKRNRLVAGALAAIMSMALLTGCGSTNSGTTTAAAGDTTTTTTAATTTAAAADADAETTAPAATESTGPKEVVANLGSEPPSVNTIMNTSTGGGNVLRHVVEGLTVLDTEDKVIGGVAENWDISEDGTVYTFHLRQDSKWTNGEPVTAHDFKFAWDTVFTPATGAQYGATWAGFIKGATEALATTTEDELKAALDNIGYKVIDDYTFEVTLTGPYPFFPSICAFYTLYPVNEKAYTEIGADKYATEAEYLVTNGPFNMTSWTHESEIVMEKNPEYWNADAIKLTKLTYTMIADTNAAMNSYQAGEVDMIGLSGDQVKQIQGLGQTVLSYDDGSAWYFEFQTSQKGLNNKKVRRALTLGIDAQAFITNVVKNNSAVSYSFCPPAISSGEFTAKVGKVLTRVENNDYSEIKAMLEEGLAEEGMTLADLKVAIITDEGDVAAKNCAFFQEQWKTNLGVEASVEQMPYKARLQRMEDKDFSVVMAGWGPDYNDPMTFMDLWTTTNGNNHTSWSNADYDKLIADAMAEADPDKRTDILVQAEQLLLEEMPIGPIYNRKRDYVVSDRVVGASRTTFSDMDFRYADVVE